MDKKDNWKKFRKLSFDTKSLSKRMRKVETSSTRHAHRFVVKRLNSLQDAKRGIIIWLMLLAGLIFAVGLQSFWFQNSYRQTASVAGGTYAEGMRGPIRTLNPIYAQTSAELSAAKLIFSGLYDYDGSGHLRSDIATGYSISDKGKKYTVTLRKDVKWHDGQNLTADDVAFTVNTMKNPDVRSTLRTSWAGIKATALDPQTVEFVLPSAYAAFPHALTFSILPKHTLGSVEPGTLRENTFSISPVGTGPFTLRLLQTVKDDEGMKVAYLAKWPQYYRGPAKLDRFEIHTYATATETVKALKQRDITAALNINSEVAVIPEGMFSIRSRPTQSAVYSIFNTDSTILKDKAIRQALQIGTDTKKVRSTIPYTVPMFDLPFSKRQVETSSLPAKPEYDLVKASKLLDGAGWKSSKDGGIRMKGDQKLQLRLVAPKDSEYSLVTAELQRQWKQLGIEVELFEFDNTKTDQSFAQAVLQPRAYDVLVNELSIGADPDVFAYWHSSQATIDGLNLANYKSTIADDALLSARLRSEQSLRNEKYRVFAEQWLKDAPAIGLYQSVIEYAETPRVKSFTDDMILPTATDRYSNIQYWTTEYAQVYKTP